MIRSTLWTAIALVFLLPGAAAACSQVVNVWPGVAPGSEKWTQKERSVKNTPLGTVIFNVVTPTLTPYLPEPAKATGTGVIVAPGGAFVALAIDVEGIPVARWLQETRNRRLRAQVSDRGKARGGHSGHGHGRGRAGSALPTAFRPSKWFGSMPPSGVSLPTGSASWVSRPGRWSPAEPCCTRTPRRVELRAP